MELNEEDLIPREQVFVTLTNRGYVKRIPLDPYRVQHRGGKGVVGARRSTTRTTSPLHDREHAHRHAVLHQPWRVYRLRTHEIPDVKRQAKGLPVINLIDLDQGEKVTALIDMEEFSDSQYLVMVTKLGQIKKTPAAAYSAVRRNGLIAINLQGDDELTGYAVHGRRRAPHRHATGQGLAVHREGGRPMGRDTMGVGAMRLRPGDEIAGFDIVKPDSHVLVITQNGFGKLTPMSDYPVKSRNIQGVYTVDQTAIPKIGEIVGCASSRISPRS